MSGRDRPFGPTKSQRLRWMPAARAAAILGVPLRTMQWWCKERKLPASKPFRTKTWFIDLAALKRSRTSDDTSIWAELAAAEA